MAGKRWGSMSTLASAIRLLSFASLRVCALHVCVCVCETKSACLYVKLHRAPPMGTAGMLLLTHPSPL